MNEDFRNLLHTLDTIADSATAVRRRPKFMQWAQRIQTALTRANVENIISAHRQERIQPTLALTPHEVGENGAQDGTISPAGRL